jgi:glutaconate CoA-transferase subunit B
LEFNKVLYFSERKGQKQISQPKAVIASSLLYLEFPWDLKVSPDLVETERPTDDEINFVRRFAPTESVGKNLANELAIASMAKQVKERTI